MIELAVTAFHAGARQKFTAVIDGGVPLLQARQVLDAWLRWTAEEFELDDPVDEGGEPWYAMRVKVYPTRIAVLGVPYRGDDVILTFNRGEMTMNANRRKRLDEANELISRAKDILEEVGGEEQDAFDNMSEGLQETEKAQRMEEVASELEEAVSSLDEILSAIDSAKE